MQRSFVSLRASTKFVGLVGIGIYKVCVYIYVYKYSCRVVFWGFGFF